MSYSTKEMLTDSRGRIIPQYYDPAYDAYYPIGKAINGAYDQVNDMMKISSMQKKFRDSFGGSSVDATKWDSTIGTGGALTVAGGTLTMGSGTTINAETYILSKEIFTIPFKLSIGVTLSQRIANQEFYVEAISVDPTTGVPDNKHCAALIFSSTTATNGIYRVQNSAVTPLDSAQSTFPTTASGSFYEIEPFGDEVWFHGGTLDSTNGRANSYRRHQQIPDPNAVYKIRLRWKNLGTAPASNTNAVVQYIACQDYAELTAEITSGRGQVVAGQAIGVQVIGTPSVSGTVTSNIGSMQNAFYTDTTTNLGVSATYTGTARDGGSSTFSSQRFRVMCMHTAGVTLGHLVIEQSTDNTTFRETHRIPIPSDASYRLFEFPILLRYIRVKFINGAIAQTAFFLGTTVNKMDGNFDFDKTLNFIHSTTALGISATFTGVSMNLGQSHSILTHRAIVFADQAGTLYLEQSRDGSTWRTTKTQAVTASTPFIVEDLVAMQYLRVRYVNGGVAQTAFELLSSLIKS